MVTIMLTHEVRDFDSWIKGFNGDSAMRDNANIKIHAVYSAADNPNMVTILSEFPSQEAVQGLMGNPEMKATMEKAGVIGMPDVKVLNKVQ